MSASVCVHAHLRTITEANASKREKTHTQTPTHEYWSASIKRCHLENILRVQTNEPYKKTTNNSMACSVQGIGIPARWGCCIRARVCKSWWKYQLRLIAINECSEGWIISSSSSTHICLVRIHCHVCWLVFVYATSFFFRSCCCCCCFFNPFQSVRFWCVDFSLSPVLCCCARINYLSCANGNNNDDSKCIETRAQLWMTNSTTIPRVKRCRSRYATLLDFAKCTVYDYLLARHYNYAIVPFTLAASHSSSSSFSWTRTGARAIAFLFLLLQIDFLFVSIIFFLHSLRTILNAQNGEHGMRHYFRELLLLSLTSIENVFSAFLCVLRKKVTSYN